MADQEIVSALLRLDRDFVDLSTRVAKVDVKVDILGNRITALESTASTLRWVIPLLVAVLIPLGIQALAQ